ncbi:MAG: transposase [Verrucomicrobiota bacterium]
MTLKKSISQKLRIDGRDYSRPGWYFVTLGADYHKHLFGTVQGCEMRPNALGRLVEQCWGEIPRHYSHIKLGVWQLMPNHFHAILQITHAGGKGLGEVINVFKGAVTREWRRSVISRYSESEQPEPSVRVWAPNYYDVICIEPEKRRVREQYIQDNPRRWALRDVPEGVTDGRRYKGNTALLKPGIPRQALRISRRASEKEIAALQDDLATFSGLVCSTFMSPGEKACLQTLQEGSAHILWILPMTLPASIPVGWTEAFLEKRALWLSGFSQEVTAPTRESCEQANDWVEQFCRKNTEVIY